MRLCAIGKKVGHIERKIDDTVFNLYILLVENEPKMKFSQGLAPQFLK